MSPENKNTYQLTERGKKLKKIAVRFGGVATAVAVTVGGVSHAKEISEHFKGPESTGHQTVTVAPGDRLDDLINEHVEGGASHTGAVRAEVMNDPDNADVFENDQLDPGEKLELPAQYN